MIDTGIFYHGKKILRALLSYGVDPSELHTILLTHGHLDHIGCLADLKARSGARVICHQSIAAILENGGFEKAVPRVFGWKILNPIVSTILRGRLCPVKAEILVDDLLVFKDTGLEIRVIHTPGHSPGSCSILLEDGTCFIGDLLREPFPGKYDTGLFYDDREQILLSLRKIASYNPKTIYLSHGSSMTAGDLKIFLEGASQPRE